MTEYQIVKAHVRKRIVKHAITYNGFIFIRLEDGFGYEVYENRDHIHWFSTFDAAYSGFCELSGWDDKTPDPDYD